MPRSCCPIRTAAMAEFDDTRKVYNATRAAADAARSDLVRAAEQARRLKREAEALARKANAGRGNRAAEELGEVRKQAAAAAAAATHTKGLLAEANAAQLAALGQFAAFTDPTVAVERLSDDTPMALFPLRLETRFKTTP